MMSTLKLSNEELEELSSALATAKRLDEPSESDVRQYDFVRPEKLSKMNLKALQMIFSSLDHSWGAGLSSMLKCRATVQSNAIYQTSFGRYVDSLRPGGIILEATSDSFPGAILIDIPAGLALSIADRMIGGSGVMGERVASVTRVQGNILKCLISRLLADLDKAWSPVLTTNFTVSAVHMSEYKLGLAADEPMLISGMFWNTGAAKGSVSITLPTQSAESLVDSLNPQRWLGGSDVQLAGDAESMAGLLESVEVPISVELGHSPVSMREILNMEAGDIVMLDVKVDDELAVRIDRKLRFHARPGLVGRRMSAQITDRVVEKGRR